MRKSYCFLLIALAFCFVGCTANAQALTGDDKASIVAVDGVSVAGLPVTFEPAAAPVTFAASQTVDVVSYERASDCKTVIVEIKEHPRICRFRPGQLNKIETPQRLDLDGQHLEAFTPKLE